ncbi:MAG: PQQ-binding-like beta-propeller repeat protein [Planctomycetes bacterium]|nr:PQQ-binding-like beta-propeller repeat protein [Planctomycetota bacterium]
MTRWIPALLLVLVLGAPAGGQDKTAAPSGWRGDGTGRYPAAAPPTTWGRVSKAVRALRYHAAKPKASDAGAPMADGVIREWLVLHPAPEGFKVDKEILPNENELAPAENEKAGSAVWKKVRFDSAWMDFNAVLGKSDNGIGCAVTHVYSETGGPFRLSATTIAGFKLVLNGKPLTAGYGRTNIDLAKGWNRIFIKVAPHRTPPPDATWACSFILTARAPAEFEETGFAWTAALPGVQGGFYGGGTGVGAPVIVGNRLYLLSEPHDLICLDKTDGKVLWVRTNSYFDAAADADKKKPAYAEAETIARKLAEINALLPAGPLPGRKLEEKVATEAALSAKMLEIDPVRYKKYETPDVGFSGYTPVSDGKSLYLWLGSGVTACYDLDGKRRWIRVDNFPAVEHGFSSSPLLVDGKIVVFMRDVLAFDAKTGALAWQLPLVKHEGANPGGFFHGTPTKVVVGGLPLIVLGNGTMLRAAEGKILFTHGPMGQQAVSSPVVEGNRVLLANTGGMLFIHTLPAAAGDPLKVSTQSVSIDTPTQPRYYLPWYMASPVVVDGLAYLFNNSGVLTVVDLNEAKVVYQRMLDVDHFQTANEGPARGCGVSPALAGRHLYFFGNNGGAVVIEPGRVFKQVAKNKIESLVSVGHWGERQERFVSNPVFDGSRMYIRGEGHLYAVNAGKSPSLSTTAAKEVPAPKVSAPLSAPLAPTTPDPELVPATQYGWRRNGTGLFPEASPPTEWNEKKNIKWEAAVGKGHASPVVAGDKVIVLSEPGTLLCLGRADGKLLWKADLDFRSKGGAAPGTKEYVRPTPVTDGRNIYLSLCNGAIACYSIDGTRTWVQQVEPAPLTYGPSASPVLVGDKLLVDSTRLRALDAATGRILWTAAEGEAHYGTPAIFSLGGTLLAVSAKGTVVRVSDGALLAVNIAEGLGGDQAPTPVVQGGVVFFAYRRCSAVKLSLADGKLKAEKLWEQELPGDVIASPVLKDGMLFVVPSGSAEYRVLNAATGEVLLEKSLDLSPNLYPSLALAGRHLFLGNDQGEMLVIEPGREFKQLLKNNLPEGSGASPAFAGPHLFLRGGEILYCIGP